MKLEPYYYPLYRTRAFSLLPKWGGSQGEIEALAEKAVELTREQDGEGLYARVVAVVLKADRARHLKELFKFSERRTRQGFEDILAKYPEASYYLNLFCRWACVMKDRKLASDLFERIGTEWHSEAWAHKEQFDTWKQWAGGKDFAKPPADAE